MSLHSDHSAPPPLGHEGQPFYVTGGTLPLSAPCYVERAADAVLAAALGRGECGEFCFVLNTRQMGKSSLMARTASLLRHSGAAVAVLDLTAVGQNLSAAQWYNGLLALIGEQLGLEDETQDYWRRHADAGPMQRFLGALRDVALPAVPGELVLFIDEIDAVRSLPFPTDELFAGIRELYNRRAEDPELNRLTFCLLGVATPADLIRDTRTTPFNIGTRIDLDDFTPAEAAPLAQGMVGSRAVLDRVLYWTGGHPYLTQRLCRAIAEEPRAITTPAHVDALCERLFLSGRARDTEDNLLFVRERVLRSGLDLATLLTLYDRVLRGRTAVMDDPDNPLVSTLKLAGVVKADGAGRLQVRNRIYARAFGRAWVRENMPGAEVRRQRRAFRRGALRTGLVAAVIIAVIGTLAGVAVREAHEARRQAARFERLLYVSDMQNAQTAWDSGSLDRLRALLVQTKDSPERGWEWGYWNRRAYPPGDAVNPGDGPLVSCDLSPDGARLLTAGFNGTLRVWDTRTLRQIYSVRFPGKTLLYAQFSSDGSKFMAAGVSGGLATFSTATGKTLFTLAPKQPHAVDDLSPDLKTVMEHTRGTGITLRRTGTGRTLAVLPIPETSFGFRFANHGDKVFVGTQKPFDASIYNSRTGARLCRLQIRGGVPQDAYLTGLFSDDDRFFVTYYNHVYGSVDLWDARTGRLVRHLTDRTDLEQYILTDPAAPVVLIPDGSAMRGYSTQSGRKVFDIPFTKFQQEASPTHFSQDGRHLGFVGANGGVFLLDCKTGARSGVSLGRTGAAPDFTFLPDCSRFFSVSADGLLRRWSAGQASQTKWQTVQFPLHAHPAGIFLIGHERRALTIEKPKAAKPKIFCLWSISANRARPLALLTSSLAYFNLVPRNNPDFKAVILLPDLTTNVYDLRSGRCVGTAVGDPGRVTYPVVSPDGQRLASVCASGATSVFDVPTGARLWTRKGGNNSVGMMGFSPSNRLLGSVGAEGIIDVWDAQTGRRVAALAEPPGDYTMLEFLPGDRRLVASANQMLTCWDIPTGHRLWTSPLNFSVAQSYSCSPDGRRLLVSSLTGEVSVWDTETGDLLLTLSGNGVEPVPTFTPDGATLEVCDSAGGYVNYAADMRPHDDPAVNAVSPP